MKDTTLAYLAGLIDGEGYVGIKRTHRKDAVSFIYHERIQVRMVHEGSIRLLSTLGGAYYREHGYQGMGRRPLWCWQASDALAARMIATLFPYLVIKRANARLLLALRKSKEDPRARRRGSPAKRVMNAAVLRYRDRLYVRCKALNHAPV
jgi:hypothetical protein